jgi:hypothetical protein
MTTKNNQNNNNASTKVKKKMSDNFYDWLERFLLDQEKNQGYTLELAESLNDNAKPHYVFLEKSRNHDYPKGFYARFVNRVIDDIQLSGENKKDKWQASYDFSQFAIHHAVFFKDIGFEQFKNYCDMFIDGNRKFAAEMLVFHLSHMRHEQRKAQSVSMPGKFSAEPTTTMYDKIKRDRPVRDYFSYLFTMGNHYEMENTTLFDLKYFNKSMQEAGFSQEESYELIFSHLKNSTGLEKFSAEQYIFMANQIFSTENYKREFMLITTGKEYVFGQNSVQDRRQVSVFNFDRLTNSYNYRFTKKEALDSYMNTLMVSLNENLPELGFSGLYPASDATNFIVMARSQDEKVNDKTNALLLAVINESLLFFKNNESKLGDIFNNTDIRPAKSSIGFDMGKMILQVKLEMDCKEENTDLENNSLTWNKSGKLKI